MDYKDPIYDAIIVEKNNTTTINKINKKISYVLIISIIIVILLLFINTASQYFIAILLPCPHFDNQDQNNYNLDYLLEQAFYKTLKSTTDQNKYLALSDEQKLATIKTYILSLA